MSADLPAWIDRFWRIECPACGRKWFRSRWNPIAYSMHYALAHLGIPVFRSIHER